MKKVIFGLLLGIVLGALGWRYYERSQHPTVAQQADDLAGRTREVAVQAKNAAVDNFDDARIIAVIKGKYLVDKDLSAIAISIECRDGNVVLKGTAGSDDLIMRARKLASETNGVRNVASLLTIKN